MLGDLQIHKPTSVAEATALQAELGDEATFLAGGTELLLLMKLGLAGSAHLINLKYIPQLRGLRSAADGGIVVGGGVTHQELAESPLVRRNAPEFARTEGCLANLRVRVSGTLGGNLAFADAHSDPATYLTAVGATVTCTGPDGTSREVTVEDFTLGLYETTLLPGELVTAVTLPGSALTGGVSHQRFESQHHRPMVTVTAQVVVDETGTVTRAQLAAGSLCHRPVRLTEAESVLVGAEAAAVGEERLEQAAAAARGAVTATEDAEGAADYKLHLLGVLLRRAVEGAVTAAGATGP
jgi:carbon-monoxide dehydrogenase medium subunit